MNGTFGKEEKSGVLPFGLQEKSDFLISAGKSYFNIIIIDEQFTKFEYRLPLIYAKYISIIGETEIYSIVKVDQNKKICT